MDIGDAAAYFATLFAVFEETCVRQVVFDKWLPPDPSLRKPSSAPMRVRAPPGSRGENLESREFDRSRLFSSSCETPRDKGESPNRSTRGSLPRESFYDVNRARGEDWLHRQAPSRGRKMAL